MDPASVEAYAFLYVGVLFTASAALLTIATGDWSWAVTFATGPVFVGIGAYWLRFPDARSSAPTEFGGRHYAVFVLAVFGTIVSGALLVQELL